MFFKRSVNFLDVGQGDSALLVFKSGNILIDAGKRNYVLKPLAKTLPFFDKTIDLAIITHADTDHFEGLYFILDNYNVRLVMINDFHTKSESYKKLLNKIAEKNIKVVYGVFGAKVLGEDFNIEVLFPQKEEIDIKKTNENSIVANVFALKNNFLFTGDINDKILEKILKRNVHLEVDFLKLPHHGAKNSLNKKILEYFNFKKVIVSVGKNSYGHPNKEIIEMIDFFNRGVLRTDELGTIRFSESKEGKNSVFIGN